jgi:hypothetical protein
MTRNHLGELKVDAHVLTVGSAPNHYRFPTAIGNQGEVLIAEADGNVVFGAASVGISDHTELTNIGTHTHASLDAFVAEIQSKVDQNVQSLSSPNFTDVHVQAVSVDDELGYTQWHAELDIADDLSLVNGQGTAIMKLKQSGEIELGQPTTVKKSVRVTSPVDASVSMSRGSLAYTTELSFQTADSTGDTIRLTQDSGNSDVVVRNSSNTQIARFQEDGKFVAPTGVFTDTVNNLAGFRVIDKAITDVTHIHSGANPLASPGYNIRCAVGSTRINHGDDNTASYIDCQKEEQLFKIAGFEKLSVGYEGVTFNPHSDSSYTLPQQRGTVGQLLSSDGEGGVSWGNAEFPSTFNPSMNIDSEDRATMLFRRHGVPKWSLQTTGTSGDALIIYRAGGLPVLTMRMNGSVRIGTWKGYEIPVEAGQPGQIMRLSDGGSIVTFQDNSVVNLKDCEISSPQPCQSLVYNAANKWANKALPEHLQYSDSKTFLDTRVSSTTERSLVAFDAGRSGTGSMIWSDLDGYSREIFMAGVIKHVADAGTTCTIRFKAGQTNIMTWPITFPPIPQANGIPYSMRITYMIKNGNSILISAALSIGEVATPSFYHTGYLQSPLLDTQLHDLTAQWSVAENYITRSLFQVKNVYTG